MKQTRTQTQTHAPNMSTRHTAAQKAARKEAARLRKNANEKKRRADAKAAAAQPKPANPAQRRPAAVIEITGEPKPGDTLRIGNHVATFQHISQRKPLNEHEADRLEAGLGKAAESNRKLFLAAREVDRLKAELEAAEIHLKATREENGRILADIAPLFHRLPA